MMWNFSISSFFKLNDVDETLNVLVDDFASWLLIDKIIKFQAENSIPKVNFHAKIVQFHAKIAQFHAKIVKFLV